MMQIWFFVALTLINLGCIFLNIKFKSPEFIWLNLFAALACGFCLYFNLQSRPTEEYVYKVTQEYKELVYEVEVFKELQDPGLKNIFKDDVEKKVRNMNELILENKSRKGSKWDGYKYSEEIGNLKLIELL